MILKLPERPRLTQLSLGARQAFISVTAALSAYIPTHLVGLHQGFWSAITAIAVAQASFRDTANNGRKQFIGAAIGGLVGLGLLLGWGDHLVIYAAAIAISVMLCWALNVSESSQLAGITATILLLVPQTSAPGLTFISRIAEVWWGVCVGISIVWIERRILRMRQNEEH